MFKLIRKEGFVLATALSALIHSTWVLSVMFGGYPPKWGIDSVSLLKVAYWLVPGFLIAVAMDVGQVSTAISIRRRPTVSKAITFATFAVATYYLQWLYMLFHMPALPVSAAVSDAQSWLIIPLKNLSLWIIPLLLPLSTVLYTLSGDTVDEPETPPKTTDIQVEEVTAIVPVNTDLHQPSGEEVLQFKTQDNETLPFKIAHCERCGWEKTYHGSTSDLSAKRALATHTRSCPALVGSVIGTLP
jgi:hypothetical protein